MKNILCCALVFYGMSVWGQTADSALPTSSQNEIILTVMTVVGLALIFISLRNMRKKK